MTAGQEQHPRRVGPARGSARRLGAGAALVTLVSALAVLAAVHHHCVRHRGNVSAGREELVIDYPLDGAVFPPGIPPPLVRWRSKSGATRWTVEVRTSTTGAVLVHATTVESSYRPERSAWRAVQDAAQRSPVTLAVSALDRGSRPEVTAAISFRTSQDRVEAPIFYREVPLPFELANKDPGLIRYSLGRVDDRVPPRVLLEKLPVCGNCHSFSRDGAVMGMDVDYANDKGSYALASITPEVILSPDKLITWSDFRRDDGRLTFGLLSQVSPDGNHVVSTVKDRSIFVSLPERFAYSQLFFPVRGILAVHDRRRGGFRALPGADDPKLVQSNPSWSPDGKYLLFARARADVPPQVENTSAIVLPAAAAADYVSGKRGFQYDIYRVDWNAGAGGRAVPVAGASHNGMSNYFPKISPDGKWLVYTQARNFMLLQPDSRLIIVPAGGGKPRTMRCNRSRMNSWHSWSPDGRWLVFASKENGPYTQLWLTHVDEDGEDSPPVLLEHLGAPQRAANIPEFLPGAVDLQRIVDSFSTGGVYPYRIAKNLLRAGDARAAERMLDRGIAQGGADVEALLDRGTLRARRGDREGALSDFRRAAVLAPRDHRASYNIGLAWLAAGNPGEAIPSLDRAVRLAPREAELWRQRGAARLATGDLDGAQSDLEEAGAIQPSDTLTRLVAALAAVRRGGDATACASLGAIASTLPIGEYLAVAARSFSSQCSFPR